MSLQGAYGTNNPTAFEDYRASSSQPRLPSRAPMSVPQYSFASGIERMPTPAPRVSTPKEGVLSKPGYAEEQWSATRDAWNTPGRLAQAYDRGDFALPQQTTPGGAYADYMASGTRLEQLYDKGGATGDAWALYREDATRGLADQFAGMGLSGSEANIRGAIDLERRIAADRAREMVELAGLADRGMFDRGAEARANDQAAMGRAGFLADIASGVDSAERQRMTSAQTAAGQAQGFMEGRERGRLQDIMSVTTPATTATRQDLDAAISELIQAEIDKIQAMVDSGRMDREEGARKQADLMSMIGAGAQMYASKGGGG